MFCHMCGAQIPEGAAFCHNCGTKVVHEDSTDVQREESFFLDESTEEAENKLNVMLTKVGLDKVHAVKAIREWTGIEPDEAEELFGQVPVLLKKAVTLKEAQEIRSVFARERAEITFTDFKGRNVDIDRFEDCDNDKERTWKERLLGDKIPKWPVFWKWVLGICSFAGWGLLIGIGIILMIQLIRWFFSSFIHMIIAAAVLYVLYHKGIAEMITEFIYKRESKVLQLPEGMSVSMLLETLSGKFNYPYFKGVHYGMNGECVIEGHYSMYPVIFKKYNYIVLDYISKENNKKKRTVLLEAMAIRNYINKYFNPALPIDVVKDMKKLKLAEGQRKAVAIVSTTAIILIAVAFIFDYVSPGILQSMAVPGIEVRGAYLSKYSKKVTIEEAFDNFFDNGKWTKYDSEGYTNVVFTGVCEYSGERADIRIIFKITGENFIVDSLDINGRAESNFVLSSLLSAVYEGY